MGTLGDFIRNGIFDFISNPLVQKYSPFQGECQAAILMFHRVNEGQCEYRSSQIRKLHVSRKKLDSAIRLFQDSGIDIVTLDNVADVLKNGARGKKCVVFTFDDGYRDTYEVALPLFEKYDCPFTVYVPTAVPDNTMLWWYYMLDDLVFDNDTVDASLLGVGTTFDTSTTANKGKSYLDLINLINRMDQRLRDQKVKEWLASYGLDAADYSEKLSMSWRQVEDMSRSSLVTIGAHTANHYELAKLSEEELAYEIMHCKEVLETRTGKSVQHFCYPFGCKPVVDHREFRFAREAGFKTCTTTRHGYLTQRYRGYPERLPRILVDEETDLNLVVNRLRGSR